MNRTARAAALALCVLAAALAVWLLVRGGGSSGEAHSSAGAAPATTGTTPVARSSVPRAHPAARRGPLTLPHQGHPALLVRKGASVPLRTSPGGGLVRKLGWRTEFGSRRTFSVVETHGRWAGVPTPLLPNGQLGWVRLDSRRLISYETPYEISVDLSTLETSLLRGGRVVRSFPVTIGAPGSTTPTGRFAVTDSFIGNLNSAYGCCALALTATQPNVPSGWLGGNRIAIHGTYGPIGEAISHGCVRAADPNVRKLVNTVPVGTPVVIHY